MAYRDASEAIEQRREDARGEARDRKKVAMATAALATTAAAVQAALYWLLG